MRTNARRNVLRARSLNFGAAWALSQGLEPLLPEFRRIEGKTTVASRSEARAIEVGTKGGNGSF
jgi:hypothetical protein